MSTRIAIVVALGLGVMGLYLLGQSFSSPLSITEERDTTNRSGIMTEDGLLRGQQGEESEGDANRVAVRRGALASGSDVKSRAGTVLVRARWRDGTPAAGVAVALRSREPVDHTVVVRLTDELGIVEFKGLDPGNHEFLSDRGCAAETTVEPGKVAEVTLDLDGVEVEGVVVDGTGRAVSDAGIWLTNGHRYGWLGGRVVTRSCADGRFHIRAVPRGQSLGALASGFAPSNLVDVSDLDTSKVPVQVRLVVSSAGGAVLGVVRSPSGDPLEGVHVSVGASPRRFRYRAGNRGYVEEWTPFVTSTDKQGRFELRSVAPGEHPVAVRARGLPIWKGKIVVEAGAPTHLEVRLVAGVVVQGSVKDGAGIPVGRATVLGFDRALDETFIQTGQFGYQSVFGAPFAIADSNGHYRLSNLAPGDIHLYAIPPGRPRYGQNLVRAKTVLKAKDGEELRWDPIIQRGHTIFGLVTYRDGEPIKHCSVNLQNEKTNKHQSVMTDEDGRFLFTNIDAAYYKIWVQYRFHEAPDGTPPLQRRGVWPDTGGLHLVAAFNKPGKQMPGSITGRFQDAAGRHVQAGAPGVLLKSSNGWNASTLVKDDVFGFDKVRPGRYRLLITSGEQVIHVTDWFQLMPAQKFDMGTIITEPGGSLRIRFLCETDMEQLEPRILARHLGTGHLCRIRPRTRTEHVERNLCTGRYEVCVHGEHIARASLTTEVKTGEETAINLPLRRGFESAFEIWLPEEHGTGKIGIAIRDTAGRVCWKVTYDLCAGFPNPYKPKLYLGSGTYTIRVNTTAGHVGERGFEVKQREAGAPPIRVVLKERK